MFSWFERRLNPFPTEEPTQAPTGFFAFCWHYTKGATPFIAVTAILMAAIAIAEVWLFGFYSPDVLAVDVEGATIAYFQI